MRTGADDHHGVTKRRFVGEAEIDGQTVSLRTFTLNGASMVVNGLFWQKSMHRR
jgi:hypothetical protein